MLVIPTWLMKNSHIPQPWVVSYSILHLSILKDGQVDLHAKALSHMCWSVTVARCFCYCQMHRALITSSIRTLTPQRGWASWRTCKNPWCSLSLVSSTASNNVLSMGVTSPSHPPLDAPSSRPCIQSSLLQEPAKDWMAFPDLQGHPSSLAFIFFSITASTIAQRPSHTAFAVTSTCAILWPS